MLACLAGRSGDHSFVPRLDLADEAGLLDEPVAVQSPVLVRRQFDVELPQNLRHQLRYL